ncbi:tetratricopeptide repeat protein [Micromonospora sp. LAH09]|uniref:tetratricopeptide repeat protein n=1 Tax=Micromonospora cabrerizensis TaxID=2911213 RepID=UPI001EE83D6B|nr:tetratricopeptide repeat protein [Micromonospora cabrerizensis]MCG5467668.1 tetratricopeptide repeat protein [Micromonospora cabrerizensis]
MSDEDLWRVLRGIADMPYGAGQIAALEQLLRRVDAADDRHLAFVTRMQATTGYIYGGEPAKSFVTFSWCLSEFDQDPQPYHQRHLHNLLWHFKYMVNGLLNFPEVPLDRTYAVLDDMERRYRAGGHSLQAVHKNRFRVANHVGDAEAAAHWYRLWQTTPRDELSDCAGCDPTSQVNYLAETGRDAEAVTLSEPVLAGRLTCNEQPQAILTALLLPYLRTGRDESARDAHREAYRRLRGNLADLWDIGDHVEFCTVTGNEARAVELVERHLDWLDRAPSPAAAMHFAATAAAALRQAARSGETTLYRRAAEGRPAGEVSASVLADELTRTATGLAERFDARNGTTHQSEWIARRLTVRPRGEHLPLSASVRRRPPRPSEGESTTPPSRASAAARDAVRAGRSEAVAVAVPADAGPDELLNLAEQRWGRHDPATFRAVLAAYDERFGSAELSPRTVAHRLAMRAAERGDADDIPGAIEMNRAALEVYRTAGDELSAQVVAGRLGVLLTRSDDDADEGLALVQKAAEVLDRDGDARQRAAAHDRVALALLHRERWDDALAALDRVPPDAGGDPYLAARVALHRAHLLERADRVEEASAAAAESRRIGRELGVGELVTAACLAYARTVDDPADAVTACDEALSSASADAELPVRVARARALLAAGRAADAVDDFIEAVTLCVERGAEGDAFLRWELANAYRVVGRLGEAAEVAEEALLAFDRLGAQAEADRCRHLLAGVYAGLGEIDPALALLEQLADNLNGPDNLPYRAQVLEEAGGILYDADRDAAGAERFAAAASAYRLGSMPLDELRARRREAYAWFWADDRPAAIRAVEQVDALAATLAGQPEPPVTYELAMAAEAGARVLTAEGRPDEALARLTGVPDRLRSIEAFGEAVQVEVLTGELLLRLERPAEAEPLLRRVLGGLPADSQPVRQTAWLLARALDLLDRPAEAAVLRTEHDLDPDDD